MSQKRPWEQKVDIFRKKFVAREEQFSVRKDSFRKVTDPTTGQEKMELNKIISPVCTNYGDQAKCLIAQKKGICAECTNKVFQELTNEWVGKHIVGEEKLVLFMLRAEGMRFAAIDFDKGSTFSDAKFLRDTAAELGVPGHIARSTEKGYHLYFFFDEFIQPPVFHSLVRELFVRSGFTQRFMMQEMALPEVFPKQVTYIKNQVGNGIRVPMSEPDMKRGRNCWVDDDANPIPFDQQWEYFDKLAVVNVQQMLKQMEELNIEILHAPAGRTVDQARKQDAIARRRSEQTVGEREHKGAQYGDFWHIVGRCPALMEYWARDADGHYKWDKSNPKGLFHDARFASATIALRTKNGEDVLLKRWPGQKTESHLQQMIATGYAPTTCRWMQEHGVCRLGKHPRHGDHCLKKHPPAYPENGQIVVNPEKLPEELWPEPSPVRFSYDKDITADEIIEQLGQIFQAEKRKSEKEEPQYDNSGHPIIVPEYRPDNSSEIIDALLERARFLGSADYEKVRIAVRTNKWMKEKDFKEATKKVSTKIQEKEKEQNDQKYQHFSFKNKDYYEKENHYEVSWLDAKGVRQYTELTNYKVTIHEEESLLRVSEGQDLMETNYIDDRSWKGVVHIGGQDRAFKFNITEWMQTGEKFLSQLMKIGGGGMMHERADADMIRMCIMKFSERTKVEKKRVLDIGLHRYQQNFIFVMPSVLITKEGIMKNDQYFVSMDDDITRPLDFQILSDDELKNLCRHIIDDFFGMNKSILTMTSFAFAMASCMVEFIAQAVGYRKSPVLWLSGDTGGGKSFVLESAQFFYGDFTKGSKIGQTGSFRAKLAIAHAFRHAMTLIDDIKESIQKDGGREVLQSIQNIYDRNGRPALNRDGSTRKRTDHARGLVGITAEEFPSNESSAISRMVLVNTQLAANREKGERVLKHRHLYSGLTPHVIHFLMDVEPEDIAKMWNEYFKMFKGPIPEADHKNNADRICENMTLVMTSFRVTVDMMYSAGAISEIEREDLCRTHFKNLEMIKANMLAEARDNRGSKQFLTNISELLAAHKARFRIHGLDQDADMMDDGKGVTYLGFYSKKNPNVVYLYPNVAYESARNLATRSNKVFQSQQHVSRQLYQDGHLDLPQRTELGDHLTVLKTTPSGSRMRVWPLKMESLGIDDLSKKEAEKQASTSKNYSKDDEISLG